MHGETPTDLGDVLEAAAAFHPRFRALRAGPRGVVFVLRLATTGGDPLAEWVVDGTVWIVEQLGALATAEAGHQERQAAVIMVWPSSRITAGEREAAEALVEALRAIAHSSTLEHGMRTIACNVVICDDDSATDTRTLLEFLLSERGAFAAGATYDLRRL